MAYTFAEHAVPVVDDARCTACGECAVVCPTRTLEMRDGRVDVATRTFMGCIGCGHCMMTCPEEAIAVTGRRIDPADLVRPRGTPASFDQLDALFVGRRSVRRYAAAEVGDADLRRILEAASCAPMGIPPTEVGVAVVRGRENVRAFAAETIACFRRTNRAMGPFVLAAMRPFLGAEGYRTFRDFVRPLFDKIAAEWDAGRDVLFYDAPALMVFHRGPMGDPADPAIAATYAMLAAHAMGLGTCLIGTLGVLDRFPTIARSLGVPDGNKIGLGLTIGHPAVTFERGIRRRWAVVTGI